MNQVVIPRKPKRVQPKECMPNPSEIQIYEILIKAGFKDDQIYDAMHKAASAHANMRYAMKVLENKFRKPIDNTTDDFNERMKRRAKEGE